MAQENISAQLNDLLASRDFQPELLDKEGRPTDAENADIFTFDYVSSGGKNYGTMVIILDTDNEMQVFYGDNLGRSMEGDDKTEFFDFVQHLHKFANMRRWTYSPKNINQVKYTMQGLAAIKEGLFEGYYGTRKVSYSGEPTEARLVIQHNRTLGEADARFRYVESLFIETADSERYRLQFKNLAGGRAMLEHVRQGGKPYDVRGSHITEMVAEIATLSRFNRASAGRVLEGVTAELVTEAQQYYRSLRENLKRMASTRGYQAYFESWHPAETTLQEELVDSIKTMFVEQTLDSRIEAALPVLARLQQENRMKEADIFESWADNLSEGTWALPDTPEKHKRLQDLMSRPLIVGPDATNATEQLDDLVGDDRLFDYLEDLAARDASANVWDDTDVQLRLGDLGIQLPGQPSEDDEDDADVDATAGADQQPPVQESRVKELSMDLEDPLMSDEEFETKYGDSRENMQGRAGRVQDRKTGRFYDPEQEFDKLKNSPEFGAQMRRMAQRDGVAEGVAETLPLDDALKVLRQYGAGHFKTTSNELHFYKNGRPFSVDLIWNDDATRSVSLSQLNSAGRKLKGQGVAEDSKEDFENWKKTIAPKVAQSAIQKAVNVRAQKQALAKAITQKQINQALAKKGVAEGNNPVDHEWYRKQQERKAKAAKRQDQQQTQSDVVESLLSEYETELDSGHVLEDNLPEAKMSPQQQNDFDRMRYGTMSRKEYNAKWKKPPKSDDQVIYGKKPAVAEAGTCNHTMEGEMCPEHGLAECGMHETYDASMDPEYRRPQPRRVDPDDRDQDPVSYGSSPALQRSPEQEREFEKYIRHLNRKSNGVSEGSNDDPMNYNAAITGSYYESKADPLERLKTLASVKKS